MCKKNFFRKIAKKNLKETLWYNDINELCMWTYKIGLNWIVMNCTEKNISIRIQMKKLEQFETVTDEKYVKNNLKGLQVWNWKKLV